MREKETTALLDPYELPLEVEEEIGFEIKKPVATFDPEHNDIDWDKVFAGLIELPFDFPRD